jgi:hypothetical protein
MLLQHQSKVHNITLASPFSQRIARAFQQNGDEQDERAHVAVSENGVHLQNRSVHEKMWTMTINESMIKSLGCLFSDTALCSLR